MDAKVHALWVLSRVAQRRAERDEVLVAVRDILEDRHVSFLWEAAVETLGQLAERGDEASAKFVVGHLHRYASVGVRIACLRALVHLAHEIAHVALVVRSLHDPNPYVKRAAVLALCDFAVAGGLPENLHEFIASALARVPEDEALTTVLAQLREESFELPTATLHTPV